MKKTLIILIAGFCIASCSTYKTSDPDLSFTSVDINEDPVIPVGHIDTQGKAINFLGWIDVFVQKPNMIQADANEELVNYVLAHTAAKRGANAVIHVSYKESLNLTGRKKMFGRGQAVLLTHREEEKPAPAKPLLSAELVEPTEAVIPSPAAAETQPVTEPSIPATIEVATEAPIEETQLAEQEQAPVEQAIVVTTPPRKVPAESSAIINKQATGGVIYTPKKDSPAAEKTLFTNRSYDDLSDEQNRMQLMLNTARFIESKIQTLNDKDLHSASSRLIQMLESQQQYLHALE